MYISHTFIGSAQAFPLRGRYTAGADDVCFAPAKRSSVRMNKTKLAAFPETACGGGSATFHIVSGAVQ